MKIVRGTPMAEVVERQIIQGIQIDNGIPYMQPEGEAQYVEVETGKRWYYNNETHEIKMM